MSEKIKRINLSLVCAGLLCAFGVQSVNAGELERTLE